jgi:MFS family permease
VKKSKKFQFLLSRFCSALGDQFLLFAVPLIIYKTTQNISLVGLAFCIEWAPRVLSLPLAGTFSDRWGGRNVYLLADFVRMTVCLLGFLLMKLFPDNIFIITSLVMGICAFFYAQAFIALEATVPKLVDQADLPKVQSILQGIDQTSSILGPALAAISVLYINTLDFLLIAAGVFGLSALGILLMGSALKVPKFNPKKNVWQDIKQGAEILLSNPNLLLLTSLSFLINLIIGIALATGAAITNGTFHKPDSYFGILNTTAGLLAVISFLLIPKLIKSFSVFRLGILAYLAVVSGGILIGIANNFNLFVIGYGLACGSSGIFNVYIRTERVQWIPSQHLGKTIGLIVLLNQLSLPTAGLLVAVASGWLGTQSLFLFSSLIAGLYLTWIYKRLKRQSKTALA